MRLNILTLFDASMVIHLHLLLTPTNANVVKVLKQRFSVESTTQEVWCILSNVRSDIHQWPQLLHIQSTSDFLILAFQTT